MRDMRQGVQVNETGVCPISVRKNLSRRSIYCMNKGKRGNVLLRIGREGPEGE